MHNTKFIYTNKIVVVDIHTDTLPTQSVGRRNENTCHLHFEHTTKKQKKKSRSRSRTERNRIVQQQ